MVRRRICRHLRPATAQANVGKTVEIRLIEATIVSHRLCWYLWVEGFVGNNRCSSTTVSRLLGQRLAVEGIVGNNRQK